MNDNMKWTRQLTSAQQSVLSAVIQWMDSNGQSDSTVRQLVDDVLNHMDKVKQLSEEELDEAENA
tara:strand:- start:230 stop:424 length:195 start_codon:yes stop_codon:yes gene_type:complete